MSKHPWQCTTVLPSRRADSRSASNCRSEQILVFSDTSVFSHRRLQALLVSIIGHARKSWGTIARSSDNHCMAYAKRFTGEGAALPGGDAFLTALRGGDLDRSDHLLIELPASLPDHLLRGVAELHMLRERWDHAELTLSKLHKPDADV